MIDWTPPQSQYLFDIPTHLMDPKSIFVHSLNVIIDCIITIQNANHQIMTLLIDIYARELTRSQLTKIYKQRDQLE